MKTLSLLLVCLVALTACTPNVQVVTLRGNNLKPAPEGLVLDNDTLTLQYVFSSERGQMHISLINKLNQPLYVDWKRSSFIIGQDKLDYWYDVANVDLYGSGTSNGSRYGRYMIGSLQGTISKDDAVAFIPPNTKLTKQQFVVFPSGVLNLPGTPEVVQEKAKWVPDRKKPVDVSVYKYAVDQSPFTFRNYITLSTDKDFKTEFHIDTKFWASHVRVAPKLQVVNATTFSQDGQYSGIEPFNQKDGFYIPVPLQ
jgi:hypothetical protein